MKSIRKTVHRLLQRQKLGVLSTASEDVPYASLVAFASSEDDRHLYFVTPRATRKFANIINNARVALLVNDSVNQPRDFEKAAAVTAIGCANPVNVPQSKPILAKYLAKHPNLEAFVRSPGCELVDIRVERYILVERFQNVSEYRIGHAVKQAT